MGIAPVSEKRDEKADPRKAVQQTGIGFSLYGCEVEAAGIELPVAGQHQELDAFLHSRVDSLMQAFHRLGIKAEA